MTLQAESAHVAQVAFAAALSYRHNVIGIPKRFAALQPPGSRRFQARHATQTAQMRVFGNTIHAAQRTDTLVPFENALPQMGRIAAQTPLLHAKSGTERVTPRRHFQLAPAAEATAVRASGQNLSICPATFRQSAFRTHKTRITFDPFCIRTLQSLALGRIAQPLAEPRPQGSGLAARHHIFPVTDLENKYEICLSPIPPTTCTPFHPPKTSGSVSPLP